MVDKRSAFIGEATSSREELTDILAKKLVFVVERSVVSADDGSHEFSDQGQLVVVHGGELKNERIPENVRKKEGKNGWRRRNEVLR